MVVSAINGAGEVDSERSHSTLHAVGPGDESRSRRRRRIHRTSCPRFHASPSRVQHISKAPTHTSASRQFISHHYFSNMNAIHNVCCNDQFTPQNTEINHFLKIGLNNYFVKLHKFGTPLNNKNK